MWPFEFTAIPATSPKFMSGGSFRKFGTESKAMSAARGACAVARLRLETEKTIENRMARFMRRILPPFVATSNYNGRAHARLRVDSSCRLGRDALVVARSAARYAAG